MEGFNQLKQEFLRKWKEGLESSNFSSKKMGISERKKAIKLSADIAMAFARRSLSRKTNKNLSWSKAVMGLMAKASQSQKIMKRSKNLVRRAMTLRKKNNGNYSSRKSMVAKRLVRKRRQVLKGLVPGGDRCVDDVTLIREALDYVISLQAQVDVMRSCLVRATNELANDQNK